jgi:hypothetical protein
MLWFLAPELRGKAMSMRVVTFITALVSACCLAQPSFAAAPPELLVCGGDGHASWMLSVDYDGGKVTATGQKGVDYSGPIMQSNDDVVIWRSPVDGQDINCQPQQQFNMLTLDRQSGELSLADPGGTRRDSFTTCLPPKKN